MKQINYLNLNVDFNVDIDQELFDEYYNFLYDTIDETNLTGEYKYDCGYLIYNEVLDLCGYDFSILDKNPNLKKEKFYIFEDNLNDIKKVNKKLYDFCKRIFDNVDDYMEKNNMIKGVKILTFLKYYFSNLDEKKLSYEQFGGEHIDENYYTFHFFQNMKEVQYSIDEKYEYEYCDSTGIFFGENMEHQTYHRVVPTEEIKNRCVLLLDIN